MQLLSQDRQYGDSPVQQVPKASLLFERLSEEALAGPQTKMREAGGKADPEEGGQRHDGQGLHSLQEKHAHHR